MKIGVYASCRNEERNLDGWLDTVASADIVAINDTGSTDHTYERLRAYHWTRLKPSQLPVEPMQLSNALNIALNQLPDVDLAIRLDLDERLQPGWRESVEKAWADHDGTPLILRPWFDHHGCRYRHTRIHSRHGFRWDLPVHEALVGDVPHTILDVDTTIEHHQDPTKDRSQILDELAAGCTAADPDQLRLLHYLGREHTYRGNWHDAIRLLTQHAHSDAIIDERAESWILVGDAHAALGHDPTGAYEKAAVTAPHRREPWIKLAQAHRAAGRWPDALAAAETALRITEPGWYLNQPWAWDFTPYEEAALACHYLGRHGQALEYGQRALELAPDDQRLIDNLAWYRGDTAA